MGSRFVSPFLSTSPDAIEFASNYYNCGHYCLVFS
jgi:hypothetical protein